MSEIKTDPKNVRVHDTKNREAIRRSLQELGAGRSIVVDKDGVTIAGNGVFAEARALGISVREIESDGSELIVIRRTDLAPDDPRRDALAVADNRAGDLSAFDDKALAALLEGLDVEWVAAAGFDPADFAAEIAAQSSDAPAVVDAEVPFSQELMESNNYVLLLTRNDIDWLALQEHFGITPVYPKTQRGDRANRGLGRVVDGSAYLERIRTDA